MRNIWILFKGDMKRITSNVVTAIVILGLVFLPSIFSWYNIIACWDVFGNTGNLTVAVANTDEGYKSDLVPVRVNVGDQVVSALRANDQLNWVFTTEEDAIDGAMSGKYYAAVVIPPQFSQDMMTFYSDDVEHASIVYYTNEKKSAIAPKVTDQGADQVSYQVNMTFSETLTEVGLGIASSLSEYADSSDLQGRLVSLANRVGTMGTQMSKTSSLITAYSDILGSARTMVDGSASLLAQTQDSVSEVKGIVSSGDASIDEVKAALDASTEILGEALAATADSYDNVAVAVDEAFDAANESSEKSAALLRDQAAIADTQIGVYNDLIDEIKSIQSGADEELAQELDLVIVKLEASVALQEQMRDAMLQAADDIEAGNADVQDQRESVQELVSKAQQDSQEISDSYNNDIEPQLQELSEEVSSLVASLSSSAAKLSQAGGLLQGSAGSVSDDLRDAQSILDEVANDLTESGEKLGELSSSLIEALESNDAESLKEILGDDASVLASVLAAPVQLDRQPVYPADNFGSQMAPLYTALAVWVGALLLVVVIRVNVSEKAQEELDNPHLYQLFLGRYGVFAVASLLQTTVLAVGNMLFLGIQVSDPLLYLICFWTSGLVFSFIMYSFVVSFANLGKALGVLLLIVQVTGGGGSYPLPLLPEFFQAISPYLPATHTINAMRDAMMGGPLSDFWMEMGMLLLFVIPMALLGLVLRKPLIKGLNWYVEKVEDSKLVS